MEEERKEEILQTLEKAASDEYETKWDDKGMPVSKKKTEIVRGKKSRQAGQQFELRVRKDLEEKGWIVSKWVNNIEDGKIIPAKRKFNPFSKVMTIGTGFPDFIAYKNNEAGGYTVWGVEVKVNGYLDKEEKEKCRFLLDHKIFSEIVVAKKEKDGREIKIEYAFFREKYLKENI